MEPTCSSQQCIVGMIQVINDIGPTWDPHVRPDNTYGINVY